MAILRRVAALVVNSTKADGGTGSLRRTLTAAVAAAGWEPLWLETTSADHGRGAAARALREGASLVLVYGGDGTVREVTGTMAGSGVPLGLLPAGSGNLLARALGVPVTDLGAALRIALHGRDRPIDVARVAGTDPVERFCVMGGVGLDAAMIRDAPERWKALLGWLAYLGAAVRNLGRPTVPMEIRVDDGPPVRTRARSAVVANVALLPSGNSLLPDVRPDDGILDVAIIDGHGTAGWLGVVADAVGRRGRFKDATVLRGREIRITLGTPQPRELDGDLIAEDAELVVCAEPGALLVRVPGTP